MQNTLPTVVLDIGFLGHAFDEKKSRRGAQRVAGKIFDGVKQSGQFDLAYVATSHLAGAYDFLKAQSVDESAKLLSPPGQLARARSAREIHRKLMSDVADRRLWPRIRRRLQAERVSRLLRNQLDFDPTWFDGIDIYHSPHAEFPPAVREHPRLKKFITLHDFIPLKNPEYFVRDGRPFMQALISCLTPENFAFCVSETTRNDTLNFSKISPDHVFVTPLAADGKYFYSVTDTGQIRQVCSRYQIPEAPYFLAVSAHDRHKNFPHLIRCFGELVESAELMDTSLVIVGPNPGCNPEVREALANSPRAQSRVVVAGFVEDEDLAAIYSGAEGFLFPSLAEGFGIPPLEAMQCGTPVVASNTTSIPEVVGDAGLLLPPTDVNAWCQAMLRVRRETSLRADLRQKSLSRSRLFSWERFTREILRGYQAALAS